VSVTYASYTYEHPSFLVRFPHRRRFELLRKVIAQKPATRWLDYGAGDGEVYRYYATRESPVEAVLYEPSEQLRREAMHNFRGGIPHRFVSRPEDIEGSFDLITVFEVMEHLPLPERIRFFQVAAKRLSPQGRILIEVPVEHGPILLVKEMGRSILKGRESAYRTADLLSASFLGRVKDVHHRHDPQDSRTFISPHHGFDVNRFEREISRIGAVVHRCNSPLPFLPRWLNQCRIFEFRLECRDPGEIERALCG
jgi:SAM-dependent methyltransferase